MYVASNVKYNPPNGQNLHFYQIDKDGSTTPTHKKQVYGRPSHLHPGLHALVLCGIKEAGGITIAQKPDTAIQADMLISAIESGCIDYVLSPEDIANEILRIARVS